ncbi:hypothetical protein TNCV_1756611 [Trichonephila clavipes]|nr:hypothetical protein TNCV_1756611 [Trichonephila clavipes]
MKTTLENWVASTESLRSADINKTAQYDTLHVQQCAVIAESYFQQVIGVNLLEYLKRGLECCPSDHSELMDFDGTFCSFDKLKTKSHRGLYPSNEEARLLRNDG